MIGESIIIEIRNRVAEALKQRPSAMTDDHPSLWKDYQVHLVDGSSIMAGFLMDFIGGQIQSELDRLPEGILTVLWWNTENGRNALSDAEWNFRNRDAIEPHVGNPPQDQIIEDLTKLILQELADMAEKEDMEEAE